MMQYEVYGRRSSSSAGGDILPRRRRGGNTDEEERQKRLNSNGKGKLSGLGGGIFDDPPPRRKWCTFGVFTWCQLLVQGIALVLLARYTYRLSEHIDHNENYFNDKLRIVNDMHQREISAATKRLQEVENIATELERQLIDISREEAEQEEHWEKLEEQFLNLNQAVVELMRESNGGINGDASTSSEDRVGAGAALSLPGGGRSGDSDGSIRLQKLEQAMVVLNAAVAGKDRNAATANLTASVEELHKTVASLQLQIELSLGEKIESLTESVKDAEERLRILEDDCATDPCGIHGSCVDQPHGFACNCELGWEGQRCDQLSMADGNSLEGLSSLLHG